MLRLEGIRKQIKDRLVLSNLSITIEAGTVYGLLGPNGAGKTTTINIICGLIKPDGGQVYIADTPPTPQTKTLLGVAPQQNLIYQTLTCRENLSFFGKIYGLQGKKLQQRILECLALVDLTDRMDSPAETLSGGMQRRLSLAIALVHQPRLVILDEPTTGLDIEARYQIWEVIRHLQRSGTTILLTTHLLDEAERLCDKIGILHQGKLIAEGTLPQLRQYVQAQEIVTIQTPNEQAILDRGKALGLVSRRYGNELAFWLPELLDLKEILTYFDGIPIDGISRHPVRLEHIYLEVMGYI